MIQMVCLLFLMGLNPIAAEAHPHVFIDSQFRLAVDQASVDAFEAAWALDVFSSAGLIAEYDRNADGRFRGQEKVDLAAALSSFDEFGFFIRLKMDEESIQPHSVRVVDVGVFDQQVHIKLGVELPQPVNLQQHTLSLGFGDETLYVALMAPEGSALLELSGRLAETCTPIEYDADEMYMDRWVDLSCAR